MDFKNNPLSKNSTGVLGKENKDSGLTFKGRPMASTKRLPSRGESRSTTGESFFDQQSANPYALQLVNLSQDEGAFATSLKIDILQLQDEINKMDIDWKIRNYSGETEFKKNYVTSLKKWLARNSEISSKDLIENKINSPVDIDKVMETLNVKDTKDAVRKLFKILMTLEVMITKMTELEVVTLLKYDDIFSNINKNPALGSNSSKVSQLASGLQISKFHTFLINLERQVELFSTTSRLLSTEKNLSSLKEDLSYLKTKDQIIEAINENKLELGLQESYLFAKVLKEAVDKEKKLNDDITLLCQTVELNKRKIREMEQQLNAAGGAGHSGNVRPSSAMPSRTAAGDPDYYVKLMDDLKEKFTEQITEMDKEIVHIHNKMQETKIKNDNLERAFSEAQERIKAVQEEKNKILHSFSKAAATKEESQDTFEQALRDELTNLQKAYERKIYNMELEMDNFKKDKGREILDFKQQLNREKENRILLLKKLSAYIKV